MKKSDVDFFSSTKILSMKYVSTKTSPHDFIDVGDGFRVADYVTYKSEGIVMHNLCIFKIIES